MTDRRLLLVEDNPDHAALTLRALRRSGFTADVTVACDGTEALERLRGTECLPRLVLLDLNLPNMDGLEVLRQLRSHVRTRMLPVVVLTSSDEERDVATAYQIGANSYVRKPVDSVRFAETIRQLCQYWFTLNEVPSWR